MAKPTVRNSSDEVPDGDQVEGEQGETKGISDEQSRLDAKTTSRSGRDNQSAAVWAQIQSSPPNAALQLIDKNWDTLGSEKAKGLYSFVLSNAMNSAKLADPSLLEGIQKPELQHAIASRVTRALMDESFGNAIDFVRSLPEANSRSQVIQEALTTSAPPEKVVVEIASLEGWIKNESAESVRLTLWHRVHSKPEKAGDQEALSRWIEVGKELKITD